MLKSCGNVKVNMCVCVIVIQLKYFMCEFIHSASSVGVVEALDEVGARCDRWVFVGAVDTGDQSLIIRLHEESQRLTCAGVSSRGQQNSVELMNRQENNKTISYSITVVN